MREVQRGRTLWRVRVDVGQAPGSLAALASAFAAHGLNIQGVQVHTLLEGATDEFLLDSPANTTHAGIVAAAQTGGGKKVHAEPADRHDLIDAQTRVLTLAGHIAGHTLDLPTALRALLGTDIVCREFDPGAAPTRQGERYDDTTLWLTSGTGTLMVTRAQPRFTPAEFARARALRDLYHHITRAAGQRTD
jgi:hypothetical protein